jgi:hypothetical protein
MYAIHVFGELPSVIHPFVASLYLFTPDETPWGSALEGKPAPPLALRARIAHTHPHRERGNQARCTGRLNVLIPGPCKPIQSRFTVHSVLLLRSSTSLRELVQPSVSQN